MPSYYINLEQKRKNQSQHISFQKGKRRHVSKNTKTVSDQRIGNFYLKREYDKDILLAKLFKGVFA